MVKSNGVFGLRDVRLARINEIKQLLEVLSVNRSELNKQFNQLIFELKILEDTETLEKFINGEINIELKQNDSANQS